MKIEEFERFTKIIFENFRFTDYEAITVERIILRYWRFDFIKVIV